MILAVRETLVPQVLREQLVHQAQPEHQDYQDRKVKLEQLELRALLALQDRLGHLVRLD